jgi:hypothetical protein
MDAKRLSEKARALLAASQVEPAAFCPYCGVEIVPSPTKSGKCPTCFERVIVAKRTGEYVPSLMTVEQAECNKRAATEERERNKALERAAELGFTDDDIDATIAELSAQWGHPPSPRDLVWQLSNKAVVLAVQRADTARLYRAKRIQGDVLEDEGRSRLEVDQSAHDVLLRNHDTVCIQHGMPREVFVSTLKTCCPHCAEWSGRVVPITVALAEKSLPNQECTNPRCRCSWRVDYRTAPQEA